MRHALSTIALWAALAVTTVALWAAICVGFIWLAAKAVD